jgi:hypothetical protein
MEGPEFGRQLRELQDTIVFGIGCFQAWQGIADLDDDSADALNRYRGFFLPAQRSLREVALLQFSKALDRHRGTVSLPNLLSAAMANSKVLVPRAELADLENLERRLAANDDLVRRLKSCRDQRLAHQDQRITKDTSLPFGEVRQLVEDIQAMFNSLSSWHNGSTISFDGITRMSESHTREVKRLAEAERERAHPEFRGHHT